MKTLMIIIAALTLSGCAQIKSWVPSFWDDNQSARIIDVRQRVDSINCAEPQLAQALAVSQELRWFELYSESKGWRQQDVIRLTQPMRETLDDWIKRSREREGSKTYCEIKKKLLTQQSSRAAQAVLGRF